MSLLLSVLIACAPPAAAPTDDAPAETDSGPPCPEGQLLDGDTCVPEACGVGPWGDLAVDEATVYVQAGSDGDGTADSPLGSVQAGADLAGERGGGLVAIAAGTYEEAVALGNAHDDVELVGRCAPLVTLAARGAEETPTLFVDGERGSGPDLRVGGLTLAGDGYGAWIEHATLHLTDATIDGTVGAGLILSNVVEATLERVIVRGTRSTRARWGGRGIDVEWDATLHATDCLVTANQEVGILLGTDSAVGELVDTVVSDNLPDARGDGGEGITIQYGARLTMTGGAVRGNTTAGVSALGAGSRAELYGVEVAANVPSPDGKAGHGLDADDGASVTAHDCVVTGNAYAGAGAFDPGSTIHLERTVISDTRAGTGGGTSAGLAVFGGAEATVVDSTIADTTGLGVFAADAGTIVSLTRTSVLRTRRPTDAAIGFGLAAQDFASLLVDGGEIRETEGPGAFSVAADLSLDGVAIVDNAFAGVLAADSPATVAVTRSTITGTRADAEFGGGFGVYATDTYGPTTLSLTDSTVGPHAYAAAWFDGEGSYHLVGNDLAGGGGFTLGGTPVHGNAVFAWNGVTAWDGSTGLYLAENRLHDSGTIALLLHDAAATLEANDWSGNTADVRQQACGGTTALTSDDVAGAPSASVCPDGNILIDASVAFETISLPEEGIEQ